MKQALPGQEKRKYLRLPAVFPVGLDIEDPAGNKKFYQGFTQNVSPGGLCLEVCGLSEEWADKLLLNQAVLSLKIDLRLSFSPLLATAKVAWLKHVPGTNPPRSLIGIEYCRVNENDRRRLLSFARRLVLLPKLTAAVLIVLLAFAVVFFINNFHLRFENKMLAGQMRMLVRGRETISIRLDKLNAEKAGVESQLAKNKDMIAAMETRIHEIEAERLTYLEKNDQLLKNKEEILLALRQEKEKVNQQLKVVIVDNKRLREALEGYNIEEGRLGTKLSELENKQTKLSDKTTAMFYNWMVIGQDNSTGLVLSYDGDSRLRDFAFTYDQALAAMSFIKFGEYARAARVFDFYKNQAGKISGSFANAYDLKQGNILEYTAHSGPNIILGMAMVGYGRTTHDYTYLPLCRDIADWVISLQGSDGSVSGGPGIVWCSTEHNIDAYVFLRMLEQIDNDARYPRAATAIENWLINVAYNRKHRRFNRGKDDIGIATDTTALAIAALGPGKLLEKGVDLEALVKSVEENCRVSIVLNNPAQTSKQTVAGFDFSNPSSVGRKGIISTEWTSQMVIAYQVLADYYRSHGDVSRARDYDGKAIFYLGELEKMILWRFSGTDKPSAGLPYASEGNTDTGHGWRTPEARAISAASTAYNLFARKNYNPFKL